MKLEHDDSIDVEGTPTSTFTPSGDEKDSKDHKGKLAIKAQVIGNVTDVKVEYMFHLNETNKSEIVDGIVTKLSDLKSDEILNGLELKVQENKKIENGKEIESPRDTEKSEGIESSTKIEKTVENERKKDESQKITETEKRSDR